LIDNNDKQSKLESSEKTMNTKLVDSLAQIIQTLTTEERKELDTKLSNPTQGSNPNNRLARFQHWDRIPDIEAADLKAEFAQEDIAFSETILPEYASNLQREDHA
jgi:hypothetical protein